MATNDDSTPRTENEIQQIIEDIQRAEKRIVHWKGTLSSLKNRLANQATILLVNVDFIAQLCPPEQTDQLEAVSDIRAALKNILAITTQIQEL